MDKEDLLAVCNYRRMYSEAWNGHIGFIERGEEHFPLDRDGDDGLDVLSFIGEPFDSTLSVLAMSVEDRNLAQEAYRFGLELAANRIPCTMGLSGKSVSIAFREGFLDGGGRLELILHKGMLDALDRPALRRFLSSVLVNSGVVYSPFVPRLALIGKVGRALALRDYVVTRKPSIILLGLDGAALPFVEQALMAGSDVFVHTSFLSSNHARMLAREGAHLIASASQYLAAQGQEAVAISYPDAKGNFHFAQRSYRLFRHE